MRPMSFGEFYPRYLAEHSKRACRRLHFIGTTLGIAATLHAFSTLNFWWLLAGLAAGDWVMWKDMLTGRIRF